MADREGGIEWDGDSTSPTARTDSLTEAREKDATAAEGYDPRTAQITDMDMLPEQEDQEDAGLPWTIDFRHDSRSNNAVED
jgi:hypothetical protein